MLVALAGTVGKSGKCRETTMTKRMKTNERTTEIRCLKQRGRAIHVGDEHLISVLPPANKKDIREVSKVRRNERTA